MQSAKNIAETRGGRLLTIDDEEEWNVFMDEVKAGKLKWWGLAWVGGIYKSTQSVESDGRWVWENGRDTEIEPEFFEENEMDGPQSTDGEFFGALRLPKGLEKGADGNYPKGGLCSRPSYDWSVGGLVVEYTENISSSYTFNGWALSDHPRMKGAEGENFSDRWERVVVRCRFSARAPGRWSGLMHQTDQQPICEWAGKPDKDFRY